MKIIQRLGNVYSSQKILLYRKRVTPDHRVDLQCVTVEEVDMS